MSNVTRINNRKSAQEIIDLLKGSDNITIVAIKSGEIHTWYENEREPFLMLGAIELLKRYFMDMID